MRKRVHTYFIDTSPQLLICPRHAKGHSPYYTQYAIMPCNGETIGRMYSMTTMIGFTIFSGPVKGDR